jgi:hypothetical protein
VPNLFQAKQIKQPTQPFNTFYDKGEKTEVAKLNYFMDISTHDVK